MTEHDHVDEVIDALRRARPEDLPDEQVSPHAPAAQALLQEILSMQTIQETPVAGLADHRPPRRRRLVFGGIAAAAAVSVVVVATSIVTPVEPSAAATIDAALARSSAALDRSGRAEVYFRDEFMNLDRSPRFEQEGRDLWEFSGDDWSVTLLENRYSAGVVTGPDQFAGDDDPINRYVDGEFYVYGGALDHDGPKHWFRDLHPHPSVDDQRVDPATVIADMRTAGDFEDLGTEQIDGVVAQHLRAKDPGAIPDLNLGFGDSDGRGDLLKLEVWVDDDGLVRRLDFEFERLNDPADFPDAEIPDDQIPEITRTRSVLSIRLFGFGDPITIETPADAEEIDPVG